MFKKLKNFSLVQKVIGTISVPLISYIIIAGIWVSKDYDTYKHENEMLKYFASYKIAGELISHLQVERGQSAIISFSNGKVKSDFVKPQRAKVDSILSVFEETTPGIENTFPIIKKVNSNINNLTNLRNLLDSNESKTDIIGEYTSLIRSLMNFRTTIGNFASKDIKSKLQMLTLVGEGQENAGLLRANLSSTLESDYPIETKEMRKLIDFKSGLDYSLWSPVMALSEGGTKELGNFKTREHWEKTYRAFDTVMILSQEGGYLLDAKEFFETATLVVNDIIALTKKEEKHIEKLMIIEANTAFWSLMKIIGLLATNLIVISIMLLSFSKSLRKNFNSLLQSLTDTIYNVTNVSENLSSTSQHLGSGSQQAAASIQETSSSMSEIKSMVNRTLSKANDTKDSTETVAEKVEHGNVAVNEMVDSMQSIKEANDRLEEVNRVIGSITKQTKVINEIVFKTQLLAVNASIESAKAGEAGKGFGVVAEEVTKLAQTSGEAASTISNLLDESNEKVVNLLSDVRIKVDHGSQTTKKVTEIFESIQQETQKIRQLSDDMSSACNEQDAGIQQISDAVVEIDESIQGNNKEAQTVDNLSSNLQGDIVNLQNVISQFTSFIYANKGVNHVEDKKQSKLGEVKKFPTPLQEEDEEINADDPSFKMVS